MVGPNSAALHGILNLVVDAAIAADDALNRDDTAALTEALRILGDNCRKARAAMPTQERAHG